MVLLPKKSAPLPPLDAYVSGYADRHTCAFCIEPTRRSKTGFVTLGPDLVYVCRNTIRWASESVNVSRRQCIYFFTDKQYATRAQQSALTDDPLQVSISYPRTT